MGFSRGLLILKHCKLMPVFQRKKLTKWEAGNSTGDDTKNKLGLVKCSCSNLERTKNIPLKTKMEERNQMHLVKSGHIWVFIKKFKTTPFYFGILQ